VLRDVGMNYVSDGGFTSRNAAKSKLNVRD